MCRSTALLFIAWPSTYPLNPDRSVTEEKREEFLTARQLAKHLQVSESTVRRLAAKRRIPSVRLTPRIIRFHLDAVREALEVPRYRIRHGEYAERIDDAQMSFEDLLLLS